MKKRLFNSFAILGSLICLASSCVKESSEGDVFPLAGTEISFSASTSYQNDGTRAYYNETRTVYSGTVSNGKEKIHWVNGDKINIQYNNGATASSQSSVGQGVYNITDIDQNAKEEAQIQHAGGSGNGTNLEWGSGASHAFYAVYPSTATLSSTGTVTGTIPSSQSFTYNSTQNKYLPSDMTCAYMVSYAGAGQISSDNNVTLYFSPAVTAFEFKLKLPSGASSLKIKQIQLSSADEDISGDFSLDIDGIDSNHIVGIDNVTVTSRGSKTVTATIPSGSGDANLNNSTYLDFTVFTLPVDITKLTLKIKYTNDSVQAIPLKKGDNWVHFDAGKKHIISNDNVPDEQGWVYSIANISDETVNGGATATTFTAITVNSTKTSQVSGGTSNVDWKVQYKDGSDNWQDGNPTGWTVNRTSGSNTFTVSLAATSSDTDETMTSFEASTRLLQQATPKGSDNSPYDLSRDDGSANAGTSSGTCRTANCYVVSAPGVYKFPIVYGNAISNPQSVNDFKKSAYVPYESTEGITGTNAPAPPDNWPLTQLSEVHLNYNGVDNQQVQTYYLPRFYNAACDGIDHAFVFEDLKILGGVNCTVSSPSASVLWQSSNNIIRASNISLTDSDAYITFEIKEEDIKPGNVVIAAKCTVNNGSRNVLTNEIVWSWHIWVTDKDMTPDNGFMSVNLGFVEDNNTHTGAVTKYPDRTQTFRVIQTDSGGNILSNTSDPSVGVFTEFTLTQEGAVVSNTSTAGTNTYYQWGRKDPFQSSSGTSSNPSDTGAGIRAPGTLYSAYDQALNVTTHSWLAGTSTWKVYPFFSSSGPGYVWNIQTGHEKYGAFTETVKNSLTRTSFNPNGTSWRKGWKPKSDNNQLWNSLFYNDMLNHGFVAADFTTDGANYKLKPTAFITQAELDDIINNGTYGALYPTYLVPILETGYELQVDSGGSYPYGPHTQAVANVLAGSGVFTAGTSGTDIIGTSSTVQTPYTSVERWGASIPYNLWNSYIYSENPGSPYDNKFKTIYDPCPVGYTVPTRNELSTIGYPTGYYWTDHPTMITLSPNSNPLAISSYTRYDKAYLKSDGQGTGAASASEAYRSVAASIRPMVDPKF